MRNASPFLQMRNRKNETVVLHPFGASLYSVVTADRQGRFANIALSPKVMPPLPEDGSYAGAVLAPFAGRVPGGLLPLGDGMLTLTQNEGKHHLHGGFQSLAKQMWQVQPSQTPAPDGEIRFACPAPHGLDGYPGSRLFQAWYQWFQDSSLTIDLLATTDALTYVNLSHHAYWNLSGDFSKTALGMELCIQADTVITCDGEHLPALAVPVGGTPFDFRAPTPIAAMQEVFPSHPQLAIAQGYNHAFLLNGKQPAATLRDLTTGRMLTLETDFPALMLYSGGFLNGGTLLQGNIPASPGCAIALEPQEIPPFIGNVFQEESRCLLAPGQAYRRRIRYRFDTILHS